MTQERHRAHAAGAAISSNFPERSYMHLTSTATLTYRVPIAACKLKHLELELLIDPLRGGLQLSA